MNAAKKTPSSNLSDYYSRIRLNPADRDISQDGRMRAHEKKRKNLLEHHLKLHFLLRRGARVLEYAAAILRPLGRARAGGETLSLERLAGRRLRVEREPRRTPKADQRLLVEKLRKALPGFKPKDLAGGLEETFRRLSQLPS